MSSANVVEVKINADASGFRSGSNEAKAHVDGLLSHIKEFKSEAVSSGRQARFFANELAEIVPGADGAKEAIRNLIAVGLGAGGIESMIAAAKLLVGVFHELTEEETKAHDTFVKFIDDQKRSVDALNVSVEKMLMTMRGAARAEIIAFEQTHELLVQKVDKQKELIGAQHELAGAQKALAAADTEGAIGGAALVGSWEKQVATIKGEIKALDDLIKKKRDALKPLAGADKEAAQTQMLLDRQVGEAKVRSEQEAAQSAGNLAGVLHDQEMGEAQTAADFKMALEKEIADAQLRASEATEASEINKLRIYTEQDRAQKQAVATADALAEKTKDVMKVAKPFEHAFQSAFRSIIDGSKTAGQALEDLGKGILVGIVDQLIKMAVEAIAGIIAGMLVAKTSAVSVTQGYIAEAVAGAAASQAFIPIIGPGLATGAATAMATFLEGVTGPMLSAAGGFDIPAGVNPLVQAHAREMILPANIADPLRSQLAGGGVGGGVSITINAMDGASVQRVVESDAFRRAIRESRRNGQL